MPKMTMKDSVGHIRNNPPQTPCLPTHKDTWNGAGESAHLRTAFSAVSSGECEAHVVIKVSNLGLVLSLQTPEQEKLLHFREGKVYPVPLE